VIVSRGTCGGMASARCVESLSIFFNWDEAAGWAIYHRSVLTRVGSRTNTGTVRVIDIHRLSMHVP